jgi:D-arginine dehydrogenase
VNAHYAALVIGGGIAGASLAYELALDCDVALLDMESTLGYHATSRSAAMFLETYGGADVRALTVASRGFFEEPPSDFEPNLLRPRPLVQIARTGREHVISELFEALAQHSSCAELVTPDQVGELCPIIRSGMISGGLYEPSAMEIDVDAIHQGYIRGFRRRGGVVHRSSAVTALERTETGWVAEVEDHSTFTAPTIINAAGAWADQVAGLAGIDGLELIPRRRTAFITDAPPGIVTDSLPLLYDVDETFYIKPDGSQMLCSPADKTACHPHDARPDEMEIARCLDEIREYTTLPARSVRSAWAGLRTFSPDENLVIGFEPRSTGFFWLAAQGGYGVQTAPAAGRFAAALIRAQEPPVDLLENGFDPKRVDPARFR